MVSIKVCGRVSKLRYHTVLNSILKCLTVLFQKNKSEIYYKNAVLDSPWLKIPNVGKPLQK